MEENLNVEMQMMCPGNESDFMHCVFSSDDEMLKFYLTLNYFICPVTNLMERTDVERLENMQKVLGYYAHFFRPIERHTYEGIADIIKGFGQYMMSTEISKHKRMCTAESVGNHLQFVTRIASGAEQVKQMTHAIHSHIYNVKYLLEKMQENAPEENISEENELKE